MLAMLWLIVSYSGGVVAVQVTPEAAKQEAGEVREIRVQVEPGATRAQVEDRIKAAVRQAQGEAKAAWAEAEERRARPLVGRSGSL